MTPQHDPRARSRRTGGGPGAALVVVVGLAAGGAQADARRESLEERMAGCTERTGYDDDAPIEEHALGAGERAWRRCVYQGIEELVIPPSAVPEAYVRLIAQDRMMTDLIERGRITRSDRRERLDALVSAIESGEPTTDAAGPRASELEGMRDEMRAARDEMRRMREIQSMMAR